MLFLKVYDAKEDDWELNEDNYTSIIPDDFSKYSRDARAVLEILLDKYMNQGITEVEDIKVLSLADFEKYGKPAKIVELFGGKTQYEQAVRDLESNIYTDVG